MIYKTKVEVSRLCQHENTVLHEFKYTKLNISICSNNLLIRWNTTCCSKYCALNIKFHKKLLNIFVFDNQLLGSKKKKNLVNMCALCLTNYIYKIYETPGGGSHRSDNEQIMRWNLI